MRSPREGTCYVYTLNRLHVFCSAAPLNLYWACNMLPPDCSLVPLWFCGYPTRPLDAHCATLIIIIPFRQLLLMPALDALKALWILLVFLIVFFWLPAHLFLGKPDSPKVIRVAGNWARAVLCVTILVFLLSSLRVLGAVTGVLLFLGAIALGWIRKRVGTNRTLLMTLQEAVINIIQEFEARGLGRFLLARKPSFLSDTRSWRFRLNGWLRIVEGKELLTACFIVAVGTTVILRTEHAVRELRFDQPEQYSALLRAREFMLNLHTAGRPLVFPAIIAATSLVSGADPTQVMRFLTPVIDLSVVLAVG